MTKFNEIALILLALLTSYGWTNDSSKVQLLKDIPNHTHSHDSDTHPLDFHFNYGDIAYNHFLENDLWIQSVEGPGSRTSVRKGLSLSGGPWLQPRLWNQSNAMDLPFDQSGLYARDEFVFTNELNLHGMNGTLKAPRPQLYPVPQTRIQWERGPYAGNAFQLNFERRLTNSVHLGLNLQSRSTDSLGVWSYQNSTHQPYINSIGRDSTQIPFTGRNLAQEQLLMTPWIDFKIQDAHLRYYANFLHIDNQESENRRITPNPINPFIENIYEAGIVEILNKENQHNFEFTSAKLWGRQFQTNYSLSSRRIRYSNLRQWDLSNRTGSLRDQSLPNQITQNENLQHLEFKSYNHPDSDFDWPVLLLPHLKFQGELREVSQYQVEPFRSNQLSSLQEDRQIGLLYWQTQESRLELGMQRLGLLRNQSHFFRAWSASHHQHFNSQSLGDFDVNLAASQFAQAPTLEDREIFERTRLWFTNPNLSVSEVTNYEVSPSWSFQKSSWGLGLQTSLSGEYIERPLAPEWLISRFFGDSLPGQRTLRTINFDRGYQTAAKVGGSVRLGNWSTQINKIFTLQNSYTLNNISYEARQIPQALYQGQIHWKRILLSKQNLGISMRWDWTWVGEREEWLVADSPTEAYTQAADGSAIGRTEVYAEKIILPHYLALDFEARIKISTFELFYRINNFNHDIYHTEPGYTPAGLQFRWGVVWGFEG